MEAISRSIKAQLPGWFLVCGTLVLWSATGSADEGSDIYRESCAVCHAVGVQGVPGAPKLGSSADWGARLAAGRQELLHSVLRGKGAMPPKGGNASLTDTQARVALEYMLSNIKIINEPVVHAAKLPGLVELRNKAKRQENTD